MKKFLLAPVLALAVLLVQAVPGWCGQDISLKARPGLAGIFKYNRPVVVRVEIDNTGDAVKGQLVVAPRDRERSPGARGTVYMSDVEVPAGGKAALDLVVSGELASGSPLVSLVAGGATLAETKLEGTGLGGGMVVLPLGERMTGSSLFTWLDKKYGGQVTVKYLPPGEIPEKSLFLGAADVIAVDGEASSRLKPRQVEALREWVRLGGTLVLSGEAMASWEPFVVSAGADRDENGISRMPLGRGRVILSRTPLQDINDPEGKAWESMSLYPGDSGDREGEFKQVLADSSSYFPMARAPGIPVLSLLWLAYLLVAGPGLYLILKRVNRRDLAWVLVPAVAAAAALGFYAMSPVGGQQAYLSHISSTLDIVDENLAEVRSSGSFVLPRGGSLEVKGVGQALLEPVNYYSARPGQQAVAYNSGNQSGVVFGNVEYGSMRQVHSNGVLSGVGGMTGKVFFRDDRVMGDLKNNTHFNLRDCRLVLGRNILELGDIPAGETRKLDDSFNWGQIVTDPGEVYRMNAPSQLIARESALMTDFTVRRESTGGVYFLGWCDSPPDQFEVVRPQGQGSASGLTLVRQRIGLDFPGGSFNLPAGFIKNNVTGLGGGFGEDPRGLMVHRGAVQISYDLPGTLNSHNYRVTGIEVATDFRGTSYDVELYRQDTREWEKVDPSGWKVTGPDAARYVSGQGAIEVKVTSQAEKAEAVFSGISVEGVIGQ